MKNLKLYGLMRTCTNLAAWMIEENFQDVRVWHNRGAWKHGRPIATGDDGYLVCVKNPLAWIDSMMRYRPAGVPSLVETWNRTNRAFLEFAGSERSAHLVRHEDLLESHESVLDRLGAAFTLARAGSVYRRQEQEMWRGGDEMRCEVTDRRFDSSYYTDRLYFDALGKECCALIHDLIDREICDGLGYGTQWLVQ